MSERTCSVDGCDRTGRISLGLCSKHYQRFKLYGTTEDRPPRRWVMCDHIECSRQARAGGLCRAHAAGGEGPLSHRQGRPQRSSADYCAFPDCGRPHKTGGFCYAHNEQTLQGVGSGSTCIKVDCDVESLARGLCLRHLRFRYMTLRQYNLTLDQYDEMLLAQGGLCVICKGVNANGSWLSVDHDHACCPKKGESCGRCVRALLCGNCNLMIGQSGDSAERLRASADYLDRWNAREVMRAV
jgi:hypothetical protein